MENNMEGLILHVENELDDVFIVQRAMTKVSIINPIFHVEDGEQAMEYFLGQGIYSDREKHPFPSLVLLDLSMPRMGGLEFLAWIRAQPRIKRSLIVVLTSSQNQSDISAAYDHGANGYLVKSLLAIELQTSFAALKAFWLGANQGPTL